jgi:predicted glycoside hydrolase/deacetylase ChbG (UPF0249 family)
MKKLFFFFLFSNVLFSASLAQQAPRLLVRGDDMGYTHSGNQALIKCYQNGIEKSIEVLVPSPWFPEAVKLLKQNPGVDVGIHLDLTSEWENIKWRPLSDCPSLKDSAGYFFPMVYPNKNYPGRSITEQRWKIEDVEKEFRAQIELGLKNIQHISHFSAHMGCTNLSPEVRALTIRLAKEYKIPVDPEWDYKGFVGYDGPHKTSEEKIESFIRMLNKLEPGKTYIFLDHPGLCNDELKAVFHIGYEGVCEDRQGVTDTFTSDKVKAVIKQKGIQLITYRDLK